MTSRFEKLAISCNLTAIEGCGDELVFKLHGWRTTKAGTLVNYQLELKGCRHSVRQLLEELRKMHLRDRERLHREEARIVREVNSLTAEQS